MSSGLTATPLGGPDEFNWVFLIEILVDAVLALFFLFYFNRLLGTVVSYGIRAWTWHRYKAYIDISALQISPLGGRIFFKSIRYHAHNITLLVHDGHITWRYWLRMVQDAQIFDVEDTGKPSNDQASSTSHSDDRGSKNSKDEKPRSRSIGKEEKAGGRAKKQLPCRISVKVSGVEAFIYNRSPLYDNIIEQTLKRAKSAAQSSGRGEKNDRDSDPAFTSDSEPPNSGSAEKVDTRDAPSVASIGQQGDGETSKRPALPTWLRIFPIRIECKRAAAVVGNENTTSVITSKVERAVGTVDVGRSGPFDVFKLLFNFDLEKINVAMKPNNDFKQRQLSSAQNVLKEKELDIEPPERFNSLHLQKAHKKWPLAAWMSSRSKGNAGSLRARSLKSGSAAEHMPEDVLPGEAQWHGLARYLDEKNLDEHDEWQGIEYAKASALADIDALTMSFYFDMPGIVPYRTDNTYDSVDNPYVNDMNGSKPPDYGLDFFVHGGTVQYGPWADRQRINLQQIFFPAPYVDAFPANRLKAGETRTWSVFKIFVSVEKDVVLRIPTREPSKDEKWQGRADKMKAGQSQDSEEPKRKGKPSKKSRGTKRPKDKKTNTSADVRPYGWLDITVKADTTVNYIMDMFAGPSGYKNTLDVDATGTEISSSVNHGLLWKTGPISVEADLSQRNTWRTLRSWPFDITIDDMQLFILRDHLFLIIDLVNDWSSGAISEFFTFVPYQYDMHMQFRNFCMYLNVNDANIVNEPANFDRCDFLTLEGFLDANLSIDMTKYRPVRNMITFDVLASKLSMRMLSPPRSTFNTFVKDKQVATLPKLTLSGSYSGHLEERVGLTDTLRFDIVGSGLSLMAYGFLVRQLVNIKENYFGDYLHFKTLEEFQEADEDLAVANLKTASIPKPKSINELDVILCIIAEDATVMLPTTLYSGEEFVRIELPVANLDLRILSYYLDMGLQLSPIRVLSGRSTNEQDESPVETESSTQLFVKHVDLDGHRSFGPPPNEPAYISQWTIDIGAITGEFNSSFLHDLAMAGMAFAFSFPDRENALPLASPTEVNDLTAVQVHTDIVKVWMHLGQDALLFSADPVEVWTNDWARELFSQRISVLAPNVTLAIVDRYSASRHRAHGKRKSPAKTYAFLQTGVSVNVTQRTPHFAAERRKQQAHLRICDQRTNRAPFLLRDSYLASGDGAIDQDYEPPCMPYPVLPPPLGGRYRAREAASIKSASSVSSRGSVRSESSVSSSLSASIRATGLSIPGSVKRAEHLNQSSTSPAQVSQEERSLRPVTIVRSQAGLFDNKTERLPPITMAFSSSYSEPYFPLHALEPDEAQVPRFEAIESGSDDKVEVTSLSDVIIDPDMDMELGQTSVFIRLLPGIRAYFEPHCADSVANLLQIVLPHTPEETMDAFQMECLGSVLKRQQVLHRVGKVLEINISLPSASLRVFNPGMDGRRSDQVDIKLDSVEVSLRLRTEESTREQNESVAVHATVQHIEASLKADGAAQNQIPAIRTHVKDVLVWLAAASIDSIHATVGDTDVVVAGEQAEYLCDLALSMVDLVNHAQTETQAPMTVQQKRLALLMDTLMHNSDETADPMFLSSLTFLLRAFEDHFRNDDNWKILMRLRYMLQNLVPQVKHELSTKAKSVGREPLKIITMKELENWAQWRNWDVPTIGETLVFQTLFDHLDGSISVEMTGKALALTVRSECLRVAVEAAKGANEVILRDISLGLDQTPPSRPTGLLLMEENTRKRSLIQVHSSLVLISADWSAFSVAEAVVPCVGKLQKLIPSSNTKDEPPTAKTLDERLSRQEFQFVLSTDQGVISLQTINLRHKAVAERLKLCVIGTTQASERYGPCLSVVVNAQNATTELYTQQQRCIWQTNLILPGIYIDQVHPLSWVDETPSTVVAVSYEELHVEVQEQAPGLLHLIESIILDEAAKVVQLIKSAQPTNKPTPEDSTVTNTTSSSITAAPKIHVALLAGHLKIELALLSTLSYKLEGIAASVRVAPDMVLSNTWGIDFDVGGQTHVFINSSANENHVQNILDVPPINGHVGVSTASSTTSLSVAATMESVKVDATAIQGVMSVISRPEVKQVIETTKINVDELRRHIQSLDLEPSIAKAPDPPNKKPLVFDVRFAVQGIRVGAKTPSALPNSVTELEFGIGPLHMTASNKPVQSSGSIHLPEVRAQIRDIGARLQIVQNGNQIPCGNLTLTIDLLFRAHLDGDGKVEREIKIQSQGFEVNAFPHTASTAVDVINHLQDQLRTLDLSIERHYLRHLKDSRHHSIAHKTSDGSVESTNAEVAFSAEDLLSIQTSIELRDIRVAWLVDQQFAHAKNARIADLIMSLERVELKTRGGHEAQLTIEDLQLSLTPKGMDVQKRSSNSALLPNVSFSVGYWTIDQKRSLSFKATGKPLELRLESKFVGPVNAVQKSITAAVGNFKKDTATWKMRSTAKGNTREPLFDVKKIGSLLVEADFAGAQVFMRGSNPWDRTLYSTTTRPQQYEARHGRYGQFAAEGSSMQTTVQAPGIALKLEYNAKTSQPTINGELQIDASKNMLLPNVVPLLKEVSDNVKEVVQSSEKSEPTPEAQQAETKASQRFFEDDTIISADPTAIFGKTKVDLGLRICRQEFGLTCQPIARIDASAGLDDLYITMNTVDSEEHGHFFALSATVTKLTAQVKHMYSREPTFSYDMDSIVLSVQNSKHLSGTSGISAILRVNPTKMHINARQLQDLLLFREIYLPPEIRLATTLAMSSPTQAGPVRPEDIFTQRYQAVASAAAFPWNATVSIAELAIELDLGQSIGKSSFSITNLWASQAKSSNSQQNLCIGMDEMGVKSAGRMSGFVMLNDLAIRTAITWLDTTSDASRTPLIQASVGFQRLRAKAAFDYQAFAFGDVEGLNFLMYNVHDGDNARDRLVAVLDCEKAYVFCTSTSPAQAVGLYQAFDRLIQEKQMAFKQSLQDIEKHMRRESVMIPTRYGPPVTDSPMMPKEPKSSISLHTDVVLTIGAISFGVFPSTFFDSQILKLEANNIQARFAVGLEGSKIHSGLGMTLGQLQVALASARRATAVPKALDVTVDDVVNTAVNAKGGIILRVPKVVAAMQTWQEPDSNHVDYVFKSLFSGKIDVGWNLSRINFIKGMWMAQSRALASRLGKALPQSAVKITAGPADPPPEGKESNTQVSASTQHEKITAEVSLPQSRYHYRALEPPVIETPQLRDMGEATPPLEWIGLHRDRLPNVTHQIIIVSLLEVAREVEDAYERILGSS